MDNVPIKRHLDSARADLPTDGVETEQVTASRIYDEADDEAQGDASKGTMESVAEQNVG